MLSGSVQLHERGGGQVRSAGGCQLRDGFSNALAAVDCTCQLPLYPVTGRSGRSCGSTVPAGGRTGAVTMNGASLALMWASPAFYKCVPGSVYCLACITFPHRCVRLGPILLFRAHRPRARRASTTQRPMRAPPILHARCSCPRACASKARCFARPSSACAEPRAIAPCSPCRSRGRITSIVSFAPARLCALG